MGYIWLPSSGLGPNAQGVFSMFTANALSAGVPGTDPSDAPFNNRFDQWIPFDTTLKSLFIRCTAAPGATKTENYRIHDNSGTNVSAIQQISGAVSDEVSNSIEEVLPGLDPTSDATILASRIYGTAWPSTSGNAAGSGYGAFEYFDAAHPGYLWWVCGAAHALTGATFGGSAAYANMHDIAISSAATNQQAKQIRCPIRGRLKYATAIWRGYLSTTTVEACVQVGTIGAGIDTPILLTMPGHASLTTVFQALTPSTTEVDVAEGEFINWRIQRTAGAATAGFICLVLGFAPGL